MKRTISAIVICVVATFVAILLQPTAHGDTVASPDAMLAAATPPASPPVARDKGRSFASQFFITRKVNPSTGETQVEILGSFVIWFLLLLSIASFGLIGNIVVTNHRNGILPEGLMSEIQSLLSAGKYRDAMQLTQKDSSFFSQVVHAALREASHGFSAVIRGLEQKSDELTTIRLRKIELLNVLGQVSPMIGLFGTVYGMILAFQTIKAAGGTPDPAMLAGGIGTALTTTFWGLIVAIPALAGYAIVRNRIDELTTEATLRAEELLNQFRPKANARAAGAPAPRVEGAE